MAKIAENMELEERLAGWSWVNLKEDGEGGEMFSHKWKVLLSPPWHQLQLCPLWQEGWEVSWTPCHQ